MGHLPTPSPVCSILSFITQGHTALAFVDVGAFVDTAADVDSAGFLRIFCFYISASV
jgi:hypothetical protein